MKEDRQQLGDLRGKKKKKNLKGETGEKRPIFFRIVGGELERGSGKLGSREGPIGYGHNVFFVSVSFHYFAPFSVGFFSIIMLTESEG